MFIDCIFILLQILSQDKSINIMLLLLLLLLLLYRLKKEITFSIVYNINALRIFNFIKYFKYQQICNKEINKYSQTIDQIQFWAYLQKR